MKESYSIGCAFCKVSRLALRTQVPHRISVLNIVLVSFRMRKLRPKCLNDITPGINDDHIYSPSPLISFLEAASPLSSCCCCSVTTQSCPAVCDPMDCSTSAFPVLQYLLEFAQTHVHQVRDAVQPSHPLLLLFFLPYSFPALVSSNLSALGIRWPKYWSFSFSISPSNEYSELISFRIDWFDFLAVQRALKSFLQHHM